MNAYRSTTGFTIVELIVIIFVVGILATLGAVSYVRYLDNSAEQEAMVDLGRAATQLEKHKATVGGYPTSESEVDDGKGFSRSDAERTYTYVGSPAMFCLSTVSSRSGKAFRVDHTDRTAAEGDCSGVSASTPSAPPLNVDLAYGGGHSAEITFTLPAGVSVSSNWRIKTSCPGGGGATLERTAIPAILTVTTSGSTIKVANTSTSVDNWRTAFGCDIKRTTARVSYYHGGAWSTEAVAHVRSLL